ncbi:ribonuclease III [Gudongella sp. DL1XJH-153]|uniref:ribonuclease III n=1 Tax=Gudongella sp. DL1XJH-153 TaxID=3409804 RepID=UPI003BB4E874
MNGYPEFSKLDELQKKLRYQFEDIELLETALTHSSYANEHGLHASKSNQRLEFLGDTVLGLVVSEYLFMKYPFYPEGELTKIRAKVVSEPSLALAARRIDLGSFLLLGKGEENTGGRDRDSILADASESITGAIFMDSNYETAKEFLLKNFETIIVKAVARGSLFVDYKTILQEKLQKISREKLAYSVAKEEGPDHDKLFYVDVSIGGDIIGSGIGRNKKEAEQMAAKEALILMGGDYD